MNSELVTVATFQFLPEAEVSKLHLEAEGLTVFLADAETISMDWTLGIALGNVKLQVPAAQADAAAALLERVRGGDAGRPATEADTNVCLACGAVLPEDVDQCAACGWSYAETNAE